MPFQIEVDDARVLLSALVDRVLAGEEIVIARAGTPVARLSPIEAPTSRVRVPGSRAGKMRMSDDFDEPLPDDFLSTELP